MLADSYIRDYIISQFFQDKNLPWSPDRQFLATEEGRAPTKPLAMAAPHDYRLFRRERSTMRLHSLEHVPFEDLAQIGVWAQEQGHHITRTRFYAADPLPSWQDFDWLVVMGGPMNIYEEDRYPWLAQEKACIAEAIAHGRLVLGICLGAQLIADVLGGPVTKNAYKEIGWFPVKLSAAAADSPLFHDFPKEFMAFHWHGDTFALPPGAQHMAASVACAQQAFTYSDKVVGLQFHLESTPASVQKLIEHCGDELRNGPYIQTAEEMLSQKHFFLDIGKNMTRLLDNLAAQSD